MRTQQTAPKTIDEYIAKFPPDVQKILQTTREAIRNAAPDAEETISYQMPAFTLKGTLVYFGAFKKHLGFYPTASGIEKFKDDLSVYAGSKGAVQFPYDQPVPFELISRIVEFRVTENLDGTEVKKKR